MHLLRLPSIALLALELILNVLPGNVQVSAQSSTLSTATSAAPNATSSSIPLGTRAKFGLQPNWMQVNSIYIGILPDWSRQSPLDVNRALGSNVAIVGDYVYVSQQDISFSQIRYHSNDLLRLKSNSIYAPAILPGFGLYNWTGQMSTNLVNAAASLNQAGVTVWLRFAYEMNGNWMAYGLQPDAFIYAFRNVSATLKANPQAKSTYMLWSPNIGSGSVDGIEGYTPYYPGDDVVDLVGLSFYYAGDQKLYNTVPDANLFSSGFSSFYNLYNHKPVVVSESSAPYHYQIPASLVTGGADSELIGPLPNISNLTPVGNASELAMKQQWFQQMTGPKAAALFPNLTAVSWFNYFKEGNGSQLVDFRATGGNPDVEAWFRSYCGNVTAYQGGYDGAATRALPRITLMSFVSLIILMEWTVLDYLR